MLHYATLAPRRRTGLAVLALAAATLTTAVKPPRAVALYQPVRESVQAAEPSIAPSDRAIRAASAARTVLVDIDERGHVGARIEHSDPEGVFDAASLQAVVQWRFEPATRNGVAIREQVRVPITFSVPREADDVAD